MKDEGFLREVHGGLEFRNELIRAQAYYGVAGPVRQHLHRNVGEVLAARPDPERCSIFLEIPWHLLRGGDVSGATVHGLEGAEEALRVGAPYEAERLLEALRRHHSQAQSPQIHILLAASLLDQSKAAAALSILDTLVNEPHLPPCTTAKVTRMRAAAIYLTNRDTGQSHFEAADVALAAAQRADDVELVARALFEYARSGAAAGDEQRVRAAQSRIAELLRNPAAAAIPALHYAQGFCYYFLFEPRAAAKALECARRLLVDSRNITELSLIQTGYGNCQYHLCEFKAARDAFLAGLELALKIGDDSRASIISANLCSVLTICGDYDEAVRYGERSLALGTRALSQPVLTASFLCLAEAYSICGLTSKALDCLERARDCVTKQHSWSTSVEYLHQSACVALIMGNLGLALDLISKAEEAAWGKERCVPQAGVFEKLRVFRAAHVIGPGAASRIARDAKAQFCDRDPAYYLDALAAAAWLEKRTVGHYSRETEEELKTFERPALAGFRSLLVAQGFLT